jgi:hypothetical protein
LDIKINPDHDEAQDILDSLRQIQDTPELQAEAKSNPESVLNRLGLSGVVRHAVAFGIAGLALTVGPAQHAAGNSWWA